MSARSREDGSDTTTADETALVRAAALVQPHLWDYVSRFHAGPLERAGWQILARFGPDERAQFEADHLKHLGHVLDPGTTPAQLAGLSRQRGRSLAMLGVEMEWYAQAVACCQSMVFELVAPHRTELDTARGIAALNERCLTDLHGALQGYRDLEIAQSRVLGRVTDAVGGARTVADLSRGVLEALSLLDGMVSVFLGRPDGAGDFLVEGGAGRGVEELIAWLQAPDAPLLSSSADTETGRGPAGRAWRSGEIVRSDSYLTDPSTAPWREWGKRCGWRSCAVVPLADVTGAPHALLTLYADCPGYFAYETRSGMLDQVKSIVERAYQDLASRPQLATEVQAYGDRAGHLAALRAGEVEMFFQPVVALPSGTLLRFEALARLRDGDRLVGPGEFLPAFGDEELLELFAIGIEQSLAALSAWSRQGLLTSVSVNMPVVAARDERYLRVVREALGRHDVEPGRLTLELLETGAMQGPLAARRSGLNGFKRIGVQLAQDDLGSGYSSLLRLRHFEFDTVKIDQSLIRGTEVDPQAALQFVQPISDIAHNLGLHVTLEGLETPGLIEAATQLGVDSGQGFGIARPMPTAQVPAWARQVAPPLDPEHPQTELGGLAAHVAWEHRLTAFGTSPARRVLENRGACALTAYIHEQRGPDRHPLEAMHDEVHAEALESRGAPAHREAWGRLVAALGEG